jgi:hypothetical protein
MNVKYQRLAKPLASTLLFTIIIITLTSGIVEIIYYIRDNRDI